ncbi:hypothetical protein WA026_018135, partial [Henosepilachna vigintioctopunctata]
MSESYFPSGLILQRRMDSYTLHAENAHIYDLSDHLFASFRQCVERSSWEKDI